ncbi:MAG: ABC transporter permease, partial [Pseudomonadota bacterium]
MDLSNINLALLIAAIMIAAVPIVLAAIGEMVVEKAGVLNLGVEGMMIMGAVCGFATAMVTGSPVVAFVGAALGGMVLSLVFGILTQYFLTNQVATGLALTLFGLGLSSLIGQAYRGLKPPLTEKLDLGPLSDIPFLGQAMFSHDWVVYLSLILTIAVWAFLKYTRAGLVVRAVGENHDAAHALGYKIKLIRLCAIAFGGACAGIGGAYISLVRVPQWVDGMTAGAGWIALAIVVFGAWRAGYVLLGAYLFGGVTVLQLNLQVAGLAIPVEYLSMSPYLIT